MTIIIFGFRTPSAAEVPEILYIGDDGDKALKIANETDYPRVSKVINPTLLPVKHWTDEASEAFEEKHGEKLGKPVVTDIFGKFTVEKAPKKCEGESLEDLTVEQFKELAEKENIDLTGLTLEADIISAIEDERAIRAGDLDNLTVEELKVLAAERNVDLKGITNKADIIEAIKQGSSA